MNEIDIQMAEASPPSEYLDRSGLSRAEFAERIGTPVSRLSTYLNGRVAPSSTLLMRMRFKALGDRYAACPPTGKQADKAFFDRSDDM